MACRAALVSNRSHPLAPEIVLAAERIVVRVGRRPVGWQGGQVHAARGGQIVGAKRNNSVWICRISGRAVNVCRKAVAIDDLISGKSGIVVYKRRVESGVQGIGLNNAVICDSQTAAQNEPVAEGVPGKLPRTPRKTELRAEVSFLRTELTAAGANSHVGEKARST